MLEVQSQTRLPSVPRTDGICKLDGACSTFKPDYSGKSDSARAWQKDAKHQSTTGIETGPDGRYEAKQGDSLWGIAQRMVKKEGRHSSVAEVQKKVKELVEANKENLPGLDCNPHMLKRGSRLNLPAHTEKPGEKPDEKLQGSSATKVEPNPNHDARRDRDEPDAAAAKPVDVAPNTNLNSGANSDDRSGRSEPLVADPDKRTGSLEEVKPEIAQRTERDLTTDKPSDKPSDKPDASVNGGDVCKPADIYRDMSKFPDLNPSEFLTACRISRSIIDGDEESLKRAMTIFGGGKEGGERIARALNETFKDQGIVFDFNEMKYRNGSNPDREQTLDSFRIYHRGADKYMEVGKDSLSLGGPVLIEPGGPINYGLVGYPSEVMREATLADLSKAMKSHYCPAES